MADKIESGTRASSILGTVANSNERRPGTAGPRDPSGLPCRCRQHASDGGPDSNHSSTCSAADSYSDDHGRRGGLTDPGDFDDAELEAALREFVGPLINLLEPRYAEVVWRAEILDQSPTEIAHEMDLHKESVAERLQAGRRALLQLVMLTLQPPFEG